VAKSHGAVWVAAGILLIGLGLTTVLYLVIDGAESERLEREFSQYADHQVLAFEYDIELRLTEAASVTRLFSGSRIPSQEEFEGFVKPVLAARPELEAFAWCPRIPHEQRAEFEAALTDHGIPPQQIMEGNPTDAMRPAARRTVYYPVHYRIPRMGPVMGWNLDSVPVMKAAMEQAVASGHAAASARLTVPGQDEGVFTVVVFAPAYAPTGELRGFCVVALPVGQILAESLAFAGSDEIGVVVRDLTAPPDQQVLCTHSPDTEHEDIPISQVRTLDVGGRTWEVTSHPEPDFLARHEHRGALWGAICTTALSLVLAALIWSLVRRGQVVAALVESRTQELDDSKRLLQAIQDAVPSGIVVTNLDGFAIVDANPSALQMTGLTREQLIGSPCHGSICPLEPGVCPILDEERQVGRREFKLERPDGPPIPVIKTTTQMVLGERKYCVSAMQDLSAIKRSERSRSLAMAAIEQASEGVVITDTSGVIEYANSAFERLSGTSAEEVVGENIRALLSHSYDEAFHRELWETITRGETWAGEVVNERKDGTAYTAYLTISPIRDDAGEIVNYVAIEHDVTEERSLERQVTQLQKMEAVGRLAGGVAHDFNNLLQGMIGYAELARADLPAESSPGECIEQVLVAGQRAKTLVNQILAFSRRSEPRTRPLRVQQAIAEAYNLLRPALPATIDIQLEIDDLCRPVLADSTQLQQVIMNLCTNALDAMGESGGVLTIGLRQLDVGSETAEVLREAEAGAFALLEVLDTGQGMNESTLAKAFDPYYTTKEPGKGTGMGLAMAHSLVHAWGGTIQADSQPGRGSAFRVYLPVAARGDHSSRELRALEEVRGGDERVLVVDDEEFIVDQLRRLLEGLGYQVTTFTGSVDALDAFRGNPDAFDLVITDQTMPNLTGVELARWMLEFRPELPIILHTGYSEYVDEETAHQAGIREYVKKPVVLEDMARTVRRLLDQ